MTAPRRCFTTDQKAAILKRCLVDKVPMSDLCDEYGIKPNQIYAWQKILLRERAAAFERSETRARRIGPNQKNIAALRGQAPAEERGPRRTDGEHIPAKKRAWGALNGRWVPHDTRDSGRRLRQPLVRRDRDSRRRFVAWLGIAASKFHDWKKRYGKVNEHNAWIPRDHWLDDGRRQAILDFALEHPLEGYRRLTFMMLDADVVAVSPSSVYRVL